MDLSEYRNRPIELARVSDLLELVPMDTQSALDVGARDGHISVLLADRVASVVALDLTRPQISDPRVVCMAGDATALPFPDNHFDVVVCAEVLEHIPEPALTQACREIIRVSKRAIVIGVPFKQDIRDARCTCQNCGFINPPWGHVNSFDEDRLSALFAPCQIDQRHFVGQASPRTNSLSVRLMDYAGNPFGTYEQEEPCLQCGQSMQALTRRTSLQRVATRLAVLIKRAQALTNRPRGNWIHLRFAK